MEILIRVILDPPEVIVHEATNNTDDIVYTLQQVEKIEAGFQCNTFCKSLILKMCNTVLANQRQWVITKPIAHASNAEK